MKIQYCHSYHSLLKVKQNSLFDLDVIGAYKDMKIYKLNYGMWNYFLWNIWLKNSITHATYFESLKKRHFKMYFTTLKIT